MHWPRASASRWASSWATARAVASPVWWRGAPGHAHRLVARLGVLVYRHHREERLVCFVALARGDAAAHLRVECVRSRGHAPGLAPDRGPPQPHLARHYSPARPHERRRCHRTGRVCAARLCDRRGGLPAAHRPLLLQKGVGPAAALIQEMATEVWHWG